MVAGLKAKVHLVGILLAVKETARPEKGAATEHATPVGVEGSGILYEWIVAHRDELTFPDLKGFIQTLESVPSGKPDVAGVFK